MLYHLWVSTKAIRFHLEKQFPFVISEPDRQGHVFGPNSPETSQIVSSSGAILVVDSSFSSLASSYRWRYQISDGSSEEGTDGQSEHHHLIGSRRDWSLDFIESAHSLSGNERNSKSRRPDRRWFHQSILDGTILRCPELFTVCFSLPGKVTACSAHSSCWTEGSFSERWGDGSVEKDSQHHRLQTWRYAEKIPLRQGRSTVSAMWSLFPITMDFISVM